MKKYIGTKEIEAEPMTMGEAYERGLLQAGRVATEAERTKAGYHVRYKDGYESWSPAAPFEEAYRVADTYVDRLHIEREELTLHVGAGTFKPVKSAEIAGHEMHTEYICVHRGTIDRLIAHNGAAIAVGTTSVRTLESLYFMGLRLLKNPDLTEEQLHIRQWEPYETDCGVGAAEALSALRDWLDRNALSALHSSTQIIIAPGYDYKIVKMLVTNFHQPQSTLLLLVSAFVNGDWRRIYDYALGHDFRFLSYGDSSLLIP